MEVTLKIDDDAQERLQRRAEAMGCAGVEDLLLQLAQREAGQQEADERKLAKRMENLGYL